MSNCSCGNYGCAQCQPASSIYQCGCPDEGVVTFGSHAVVQDGQFCPKRLENNIGFYQNQITGSGQYRQTWTNSPNVALATFSVTASQEFGNLIAINADGFWRQLDFPNTDNLFLHTNAAGQLVVSALPAATVPDPLTVTTLNATSGNITNLAVSGTAAFTGLPSGSISSIVGLDGSGNLVKGSNASGVQSAMFYEASTSPSAATPNANTSVGSNMVIGNQIYDSGGSIAGVTDGQTLKILVAGKYRIDWGGEIVYTGFRRGATLNLTINGTVVNTANAASFTVGDTSQPRNKNIAGFHDQDLAINDVIRIQLANGAGANPDVYAVRVGFMKFA